MNMSEDQDPQVQGKLVTQLGSSAKYLSQGENDMSILSILRDRHLMPLTFFLISGEDDEGDRAFADAFLKLRVSVGGRGRRDMVQGEGVMKGAQPNTEAEIERPNFLSRHNPFDQEAQDKELEWKRRKGLE